MPATARDELYRFTSLKITDPEILARRKETLTRALADIPEFREAVLEAGREEGRQVEARAALRRVLALRKLPLSQADEARIDACADLGTLERWLDQAVSAESTADALR